MNDSTSLEKSTTRQLRWIRIASLAPLVAMLGIFVVSPTVRNTCLTGLGLLWAGDLSGIREWAADLGMWAPIVTGVLMIVQGIAAPIPAVLVTAANSFLFGPFWGGIYSIVTANIAAAICYGIGRGFGTSIVSRLISEETMKKYETFFQSHGILTILVARLMPFVPFDPISYFAGIAKMRFWPFFWATMIGQIPAGMAYSYLVQTVDEPNLFVVTLVCVLVGLALIGWVAKRGLAKVESNPVESSKAEREE